MEVRLELSFHFQSLSSNRTLTAFPCLQFAAQGIMAASSRMLFAFARDDGLPFAKFFSKNNPRTGVPDRTVIFTAVWCIIFSLVYLVSAAWVS